MLKSCNDIHTLNFVLILGKISFHLGIRPTASYTLGERLFRVRSAKHLYWSFGMLKMDISRPQP